jgi:hypothetical protein
MKRLYTDLQSTIPFVNSDFSDILQNQHMIAYSAYLEGLNDQPYSVNATNRGIILNGINISAIPDTTRTTHTFNWNLTIDKDALVYFDGQYYSPDPNIIGTTNYITRRLFIYPTVASASVGTSTQPRPDDRKRKFRNSEVNLDGTQVQLVRPLSQFSEDYIFKIFSDTTTSTFNPNIYQSIPYPGGPNGVPYILLEFGGTSRNLARLLKLNSTDSNDVLISYNPKNWNVNPQWSPQNQYKYGYYRDFETSTGANIFNNFGVGRNELLGFQVWNDMGGNFMVGYDRTAVTTPVSGTAFDYNYGVPGNTGGLSKVGLTFGQYGPHIHGLAPTTTNLDHAHEMPLPNPAYLGEPPRDINDVSQVNWYPISGIGAGRMPTDAMSFEPPFKTRGRPIFRQILNWGNGPGQNAWGDNPPAWDSSLYDASKHKHQIFTNSNAGFNPHENRPPYMVTLFYSKI